MVSFQMVFLWTIMSVFAAVSNVVANINNNQNNNNDNNNNINFNIVSSQNTQISSNVNNANTISIMLPPPIPVLAGRKKREAELKLARFLAREEHKNRPKLAQNATVDAISLISLDILRFVIEPKNFETLETRDCLGKRICQLAKNPSSEIQNNFLQTAMLKLTSFALLYAELEDHTQAFIHFMEAIGDDLTQIQCEDLFWKCSTDEDFVIN